jgi:hypothetical protein
MSEMEHKPEEPESPAFDWTRPPEAPVRPAFGSNESLSALIPTKNPKALFAYYVGVFSLIPCFGFLLGPIAAILGVLGLRAIRENSSLPGKAHAWVGIVLGTLVFLAHSILLVLILMNAKPSP